MRAPGAQLMLPSPNLVATCRDRTLAPYTTNGEKRLSERHSPTLAWEQGSTYPERTLLEEKPTID